MVHPRRWWKCPKGEDHQREALNKAETEEMVVQSVQIQNREINLFSYCLSELVGVAFDKK